MEIVSVCRLSVCRSVCLYQKLRHNSVSHLRDILSEFIFIEISIIKKNIKSNIKIHINFTTVKKEKRKDRWINKNNTWNSVVAIFFL